VGTSGRGKISGKGEGGRIWCKYYILMYESGKMRPVETILRMGGGRRKEKDGGSESNSLKEIIIQHLVTSLAVIQGPQLHCLQNAHLKHWSHAVTVSLKIQGSQE
jgi:hypothetical protein